MNKHDKNILSTDVRKYIIILYRHIRHLFFFLFLLEKCLIFTICLNTFVFFFFLVGGSSTIRISNANAIIHLVFFSYFSNDLILWSHLFKFQINKFFQYYLVYYFGYFTAGGNYPK